MSSLDHRAQCGRPRYRRSDRATGYGGHAVAYRLHEVAAACRSIARKSAVAVASRQRQPKKTTGSSSSSSQIRTITFCASPTVAACTGSKVWEVPQGSRTSRGKPIVNMFPLHEGEKITLVLPLFGENSSFPEDRYVFMATSLGTVKKTPLSDFSNPRKAGIIAVDLDDGDFLIGAALTDGKYDVMLFSDAGKAVRFDENDVRPMGRTARGVRGMNLEEGQQVIALLVAQKRAAVGADGHRKWLWQAHADH
jgi:DNA gyrase/topoisomerase IV subunit A